MLLEAIYYLRQCFFPKVFVCLSVCVFEGKITDRFRCHFHTVWVVGQGTNNYILVVIQNTAWNLYGVCDPIALAGVSALRVLVL